MIAAGDEIDAYGEEFFGGLRGETEPARDVLTVGDAGMDVMLLARKRKTALERFTARRSDDVADDEQVEGVQRRDDAFAFFRDFKK